MGKIQPRMKEKKILVVKKFVHMEWGLKTLEAWQNKSRMIQLLTFDYIRLIDKPYVNGVTLREQNQPLKCC